MEKAEKCEHGELDETHERVAECRACDKCGAAFMKRYRWVRFKQPKRQTDCGHPESELWSAMHTIYPGSEIFLIHCKACGAAWTAKENPPEGWKVRS